MKPIPIDPNLKIRLQTQWGEKMNQWKFIDFFLTDIQMTQPNYRYPDNYVASFKHLRDLDTSLKIYVENAVS